MASLGSAASKLVEGALQKYGVPPWARAYVYKYASRHKLETIRFVISLVSAGRKKGAVTKDHVILPNGMKFQKDSIAKLLNLFFHGEESIARLEAHWAATHNTGNPEYEAAYLELSAKDYRQARAIKNLIEGLGRRVGDAPIQTNPVFEELMGLEDWNDRIISSGIILNYSYMKIFGPIFFKSFYPISPEFMRNFGKAFSKGESPERWDETEARKIIAKGSIEKRRPLELARELLPKVRESIDHSMPLAKELKLDKEMELLKEISIAYPLYRLSELGAIDNPEKEAEAIIKKK